MKEIKTIYRCNLCGKIIVGGVFWTIEAIFPDGKGISQFEYHKNCAIKVNKILDKIHIL